MQRRQAIVGLAAASLGWRGVRAAEPSRRVAILVIAGPQVRLEDLSLPRLRSLYMSLPVNDAAGTKLVPLNQPPGTPVRVAFDRIVLGMDPDQVGRYWIDRRMRGEGSAPRSVDSPLLLQRLVAKLPGAVAYLKTEPLMEQVRALRIDGRPST